MPRQDFLPGTGRAQAFDPLEHGLYRRFLNDARCNCGDKANPGHSHIEHGQWLRAIAEGAHVGTCRQCGDYLIPQRPEQISQTRTDYEASCRNEECRWVCNAPSGRYLRGSSRLHERKSTP